jgi:hypothetical protein
MRETTVAGISNKKRNTRASNKESSAGGLQPARILKSFAVVCIVGGMVLGIVYWDRFIKQSVSASQDNVPIQLVGVPAWVNDQLKDNLYNAARADGLGLTIDEAAAQRVQRNIQTLFSWLDNVRVRTMHDRLLIEGQWRKPLVLVSLGPQKFYVDSDLAVLDFVPMPHLLIIEAKGLSATGEKPKPGLPWRRDDLAAAMELVALLNQCDYEKTADKPLLREIAAIDVSNYNGRRNKRLPHIVLHTTDNTEIIWGAELGKWQRHLEATDAEKLAKLYAHYKEYGSLLRGVKYINLRDPQDKIPLPIDNY